MFSFYFGWNKSKGNHFSVAISKFVGFSIETFHCHFYRMVCTTVSSMYVAYAVHSTTVLSVHETTLFYGLISPHLTCTHTHIVYERIVTYGGLCMWTAIHSKQNPKKQTNKKKHFQWWKNLFHAISFKPMHVDSIFPFPFTVLERALSHACVWVRMEWNKERKSGMGWVVDAMLALWVSFFLSLFIWFVCMFVSSLLFFCTSPTNSIQSSLMWKTIKQMILYLIFPKYVQFNVFFSLDIFLHNITAIFRAAHSKWKVFLVAPYAFVNIYINK